MNRENVQRGERYAKSELTGNYYRVHAWVEHEGDKITALDKERVERNNVPKEWLEELDDE